MEILNTSYFATSLFRMCFLDFEEIREIGEGAREVADFVQTRRAEGEPGTT